MEAYNWIFLVTMIAVWIAGSAAVAVFGIHLSHIEKH
jgi:hypothetical protein